MEELETKNKTGFMFEFGYMDSNPNLKPENPHLPGTRTLNPNVFWLNFLIIRLRPFKFLFLYVVYPWMYYSGHSQPYF